MLSIPRGSAVPGATMSSAPQKPRVLSRLKLLQVVTGELSHGLMKAERIRSRIAGNPCKARIRLCQGAEVRAGSVGRAALGGAGPTPVRASASVSPLSRPFTFLPAAVPAPARARTCEPPRMLRSVADVAQLAGQLNSLKHASAARPAGGAGVRGGDGERRRGRLPASTLTCRRRDEDISRREIDAGVAGQHRQHQARRLRSTPVAVRRGE